MNDADQLRHMSLATAVIKFTKPAALTYKPISVQSEMHSFVHVSWKVLRGSDRQENIINLLYELERTIAGVISRIVLLKGQLCF